MTAGLSALAATKEGAPLEKAKQTLIHPDPISNIIGVWWPRLDMGSPAALFGRPPKRPAPTPIESEALEAA